MKKKVMSVAIAVAVVLTISIVNVVSHSNKTVKAETVACACEGTCVIDGQSFLYQAINIKIPKSRDKR